MTELYNDQNEIKDAEYTIVDANTQVAILDNNSVPAIPEDPKEIVAYILKGNTEVAKIEAILKYPQITRELYKSYANLARRYAFKVFRAELVIAGILNNFKEYKKMCPKGMYKNKTDFKNQLNISKRRGDLISKISKEGLILAAKHSLKTGDTLSRSLIINFSKKKKNEDNNKPCQSLGKAVYETVKKEFNQNAKRVNYMSLFACAGTGTAYLKENGFDCKVANEFKSERAKLHQHFNPNCEMVVGDICDNVDKLVELFKEHKCELLMASPPCQTFSKSGSRNFKDPKTNLFIPTMEIIEKADPKYLSIENVMEFLEAWPEDLQEETLGSNCIGDHIVKKLEELGYNVNIDIQDGADYGTCQTRKRAIILACKKELGVWKFPKKEAKRLMLWEVISDLPSIEADEQGYDKDGNPIKYHKALPMDPAQVDMMRCVPNGKSARNVKGLKIVNTSGKDMSGKRYDCGRKDWGRPSNTITTESDSLGGFKTCHPGRPLADDKYSDARFMTILELLRITGLPDNYPFPDWAFEDNDGNYTETLIRTALGECFLPRHVKALMSTLPR